MKNHRKYLPERLCEEAEKLLYGVDERAYEEAFFASMGEKKAAPFVNEAGKAMGYFPDGFYPFETFFSPVKALAKERNVDARALFFAFFAAFLPETARLYEEYGVPEDVFAAYAARIAENVEECRAAEGFTGCGDYVWLAGFAILDLFRVGSLEFRLAPYNYRRICVEGAVFTPGEPVIQVHVPTGADIGEKARHEAYGRAASLFGTDKFVADSWLLYPEHEKMLDASSNIRAFAGEYTLAEVCETDDYEGLFRIFGRKDAYVYGGLEQSTSLQKAYAERVRNALPVGSGVGVMRYQRG